MLEKLIMSNGIVFIVKWIKIVVSLVKVVGIKFFFVKVLVKLNSWSFDSFGDMFEIVWVRFDDVFG